ncbi:NAD(P)H-hydrate epimerase [Alistipes indistinctus]|uniref:NAD(P)H-hydrate epimerase n=1 Tax=Alistipes indistinctus TaxID=626932 RepID=UPI003C6C9772
MPDLAAARAVAEEAAALAGENRRAAVFCGSGHTVARFLLERGVSVRCFLVGGRDKLTADTAEMERRLGAAGGVLEAFDPADPVKYDYALFGAGMDGKLKPVKN